MGAISCPKAIFTTSVYAGENSQTKEKCSIFLAKRNKMLTFAAAKRKMHNFLIELPSSCSPSAYIGKSDDKEASNTHQLPIIYTFITF